MIFRRNLKREPFEGLVNTDVSASRSFNVEYTNSLNRTIIVSVSNYMASGSGYVTGYLDGTSFSRADMNASSTALIYLIVPPGGTYKLIPSTGSIATLFWKEYRL